MEQSNMVEIIELSFTQSNENAEQANPTNNNYDANANEDSTKEPGCVGLTNLGNTCFMNAGLQCLFSDCVIAKYFIENFKLEENNKDTLTGAFADLVKRCWSGQFEVVQPHKFKTSIGLWYPQFRDYSQHDCQEFLALLLDGLHELLNNPSNETDYRDNSFTPASNTALVLVNPIGPNALNCTMNNGVQSEEVSSFEESSESGICMSDRDACRRSSGSTCPTKVESNNRLIMCGSSVQSTDTHCMSEDSNLSDAATDDSQISECLNKACNNENRDELVLEVPKIMNISLASTATENMNLDDNEDGPNKENTNPTWTSLRKILPSIEDFCMKDTRTLNTNVLLIDETTHISTDSDKFHKPLNINKNNIAEASEKDEAVFAMCNSFTGFIENNLPGVSSEFKVLESNNILDEVYRKNAVIRSMQSSCKIKETNVLASMCSSERYSDGKKFLDLDQPDINNIKRIKIDEDARQLKVNIVQNLQKDSENSTSSSHQISDSEVAQSSHSFVPTTLNNDHQFTLRCIRQADQSWLEYIRRNRSIIVDTFQGQFKNTVICSECHHVSVTFEPFMYLSLPIPRATEQQLSITYVSSNDRMAIRYLVTVDKNSNVAQLKKELTAVMGEQVDMLLAEVKDCSISRILDDQMSIKFINDKYYQLYAFETSPFDDFTCQEADAPAPDKGFSPTPNLRSSNCSSPFPINVENCSPVSSIHCIQDVEDDYLQAYGLPTQCEDVESFEANEGKDLSLDIDVTLNNSNNCNNMSSGEVKLESNPDINWQHNQLDDHTQTLIDPEECPGWNAKKYSNSDWHQQTADWINNSQMIFNKVDEDINLKDGSGETGKAFPSDDKLSSASTAILGREPDGKETGAWKSCAICLEEMEDSDLKIHPPCGGTLCHECLQASFKHASFALRCPVCRCSVNPNDDFIQLNCLADYKPRVKILTLPVMFRHDSVSESGQRCYTLFGHPNIIKLPNQLSGHSLYESIEKVLPCSGEYKVLITDSQGHRCSRCTYLRHCSGCEMVKDTPFLNFVPGDHLVVSYCEITPSHVEIADCIIDDESMSAMQSHSPVTLLDCFEAFTKSELLDTNNPWYCPRCRRNQCARQTMTVWRYPDTLIIHLKRFVYHDLSSTKIDSEVTFPFEDLNLSTHISGPNDVPLIYDLQSYVCHSGGVNSGHYTAYAKHPISGEWCCYNDELNYKKNPSSTDFSRAYVLFYQRKNTSVDFTLPTNAVFDQGNSSKSNAILTLPNQSLLKRGRTSSGSDLRRHVRHNSLDDINHKVDDHYLFDFLK